MMRVWRHGDGLQLGLTAGVPERLYHRGVVDGEESLSQSGMKTLLSATPQHFWHAIHHPEDRKQKKEFDLGSCVHSRVLGVDSGIVEIRRGPDRHSRYGDGAPYESFRTRDAQEKRDYAYAEGLTPILAKDVQRADRMEQVLRRHGLASELLDPDAGVPEVTAIARDPESGVLLRGRFDFLRHDQRAVDLKTVGRVAGAGPAVFSRSGYDYGYYLQAATYLHIAALCGVELTRFDFVVQEVVPPYAVSVVHFGAASLQLGRLRMRQAIDLYAECAAAGDWPGWPDASVEIDVPFWALRDLETSTTEVEGTPLRRSGHTDQTLAELDEFDAYLEGLHA